MDGKVTIIGGSGFVGTNLCTLLAEKQQDFEIIDIKLSNKFPDKCKIADVRDVNTLRKTISGNLVINLAAVHRDDVVDRREYEKTNIDGARNIAFVCSEKGIKKIIFTSTVAVYGFAPPGTDEFGTIQPYNEYGRTKFEAEEIFRKWNEARENSLIIIRPTVIFGEGNRGNVFNLFNHIASGNFVMVGDGKNKKSMAYIGNVVSFLDACISAKIKQGLFNYVDTPNLTMKELVLHVKYKLNGAKKIGFRLPFSVGMLLGHVADIIAWLTRRKFAISALRVKKFCSSSEFKSSKENLNDFRAPFTLQMGIQRTLDSEFIHPDPNREIFYTE